MPNFVEMDHAVTPGDQLMRDEGPVVPINTFGVSPEDADRLLDTWTADAAVIRPNRD